jgi:hypothetical protein
MGSSAEKIHADPRLRSLSLRGWDSVIHTAPWAEIENLEGRTLLDDYQCI